VHVTGRRGGQGLAEAAADVVALVIEVVGALVVGAEVALVVGALVVGAEVVTALLVGADVGAEDVGDVLDVGGVADERCTTGEGW
jgi:hypothetical protein